MVRPNIEDIMYLLQVSEISLGLRRNFLLLERFPSASWTMEDNGREKTSGGLTWSYTLNFITPTCWIRCALGHNSGMAVVG